LLHEGGSLAMDSEHMLPACNTEPATTLSEPIVHPSNPKECTEYPRHKLIEKKGPEGHMLRCCHQIHAMPTASNC
jgi:hypothetical protein